MTQKELLYIEDSLSHIQLCKTKWENVANAVSDPALKRFIIQMNEKNQTLYDTFYKLLEK